MCSSWYSINISITLDLREVSLKMSKGKSVGGAVIFLRWEPPEYRKYHHRINSRWNIIWLTRQVGYWLIENKICIDTNYVWGLTISYESLFDQYEFGGFTISLANLADIVLQYVILLQCKFSVIWSHNHCVSRFRVFISNYCQMVLSASLSHVFLHAIFAYALVVCYYSDTVCASWRPKSPKIRMLVKQRVQGNNKQDIKIP